MLKTEQSPLVTVYITCHNYGHFLKEAVDSVLNQSMPDWEMILINDGSTDSSLSIMEEYIRSFPGRRISLINNEKSMGLRHCANSALSMAKGKYIIRLDADDYFDENAFLLMAGYLEDHKDVVLVFSDWIYIAGNGDFLNRETRKKLNKETLVFDLPAHGACSLIRRKTLRTLGGYDLAFNTQDGYELWAKIIQKYQVANISTPLFYYRKHGESMSSDDNKLIESRRRIKKQLVDSQYKQNTLVKTAIIPVRNKSANFLNLAFEKFNGKTFLDRTIDDVIGSQLFNNIIVDTDDIEVVNYLRKRPEVICIIREGEIKSEHVPLSNVIFNVLKELETRHSLFADIVAIISINCPFREIDHIIEGVNTLLMFDVDQVISTYEDLDAHFKHSYYGMQPINPKTIDKLRFEREALYVNNGAVHIFWREAANKDSMYTGKIGHFLMEKNKSLQIKTQADLVGLVTKYANSL
jgi:glycosyltransferase involved in cell wall biosynthesis